MVEVVGWVGESSWCLWVEVMVWSCRSVWMLSEKEEVNREEVVVRYRWIR